MIEAKLEGEGREQHIVIADRGHRLELDAHTAKTLGAHLIGLAALCSETHALHRDVLPKKVVRNLSTKESKAFWASAHIAAAEVDQWPASKRAGINVSPQRPAAMTIKAATAWGYSEDSAPERWVSDGAISRDEVIADARAAGLTHFWITRGEACDPAEFVPDADEIIELAANRAHDELGESADEWPDPNPSPEALEALDVFLGEWAREHMPCAFWRAVGEPMRIEPDENLAQTAPIPDNTPIQGDPT